MSTRVRRVAIFKIHIARALLIVCLPSSTYLARVAVALGAALAEHGGRIERGLAHAAALWSSGV
jgi:hypothetical protein